MAQCQDVSDKDSVRSALKLVKRQLSTVNDEKRPERAFKRNARNQDIDMRRPPPCSNERRGGREAMAEEGLSHTGLTRVWNEDSVVYTSGTEYNWSTMSTVSSAEDHTVATSSPSRGSWHSTYQELGRTGIPSDPRPMATTGSLLGHTGAWVDSELLFFDGGSLSLDQESAEYHLDVPSAPDLGKLATPRLSPMPSTFEFCYCCDDDQDTDGDDRVNKSLRLARRDKFDAQLAWALAYVEERRCKADA